MPGFKFMLSYKILINIRRVRLGELQQNTFLSNFGLECFLLPPCEFLLRPAKSL